MNHLTHLLRNHIELRTVTLEKQEERRHIVFLMLTANPDHTF